MKLSTIYFKRPNFYLNNSLQLLKRSFASSTTEETIEIPKRIPRGPTDILRALECTISRDPTAAHYKYHDDPYLIPMSNVGKRTFAMAQEAGRKAAVWVRKENAELFNHSEADPVIPAYLPKMVFDENSKVTEEDLKNLIGTVQVQDAQFVYQLLKKNGVEVSKDTQQALLELVCYFNNEDGPSEEFIEERWFKQSSNFRDRQRKTWKDSSFADELFDSLETPSTEAYSAIIQGMCKYIQIDRAWKFYNISQEKGFILSTEAYNSLIRVSNFVKESFDMRWNFVVNILSDMNKAGVKPNLGTLNSVLHSLSTMGGGRRSKDYVINILADFRDLKVEPSLGTWYYVLITFYKERGVTSTVLYDIMTQIENKEHKIRDITDTNFFVSAMDICRNHLRDVELAKRVDKLLHFGSNYDLIGDSYKESIYYRHYFTLLATSTPLEEFMNNAYNILVPNIYIPEPNVMAEILKQIELSAATEYLPKIWSDMTVFDQTDRDNLVASILNIMVTNPPLDDAGLSERFSVIAWDIYNKVETQNMNKINKISLTGDLLGKVMLLLLRNKDFDKACTVMEKLDKGHQTVAGVPKLEALQAFVDQCIEEKLPSRAISCIEYCADSGFQEAGLLAAKLNEKLTLSEQHLGKLSKIVGDVSLSRKIAQEEL